MEKTIKKSNLVTLNAYLAHAGVCSRRKAADLVISGVVRVNEQIIKDPAYRVKPGDNVTVSGKHLMRQEYVYIMLNKPKDYVTTVSDERGRRTVMDLLHDAGKVRLYPVGRLDRATTGILILTNDGDLAQRLAHPRYEVEKVYTVTLDRNVSNADMRAIIDGIELDDGTVNVDDIAYTGTTKRVVTVALHSGKYRVIRRLFESLGYKVCTLDRIAYAGLTKKRVSVGSWRYLTKEEIASLKKEV